MTITVLAVPLEALVNCGYQKLINDCEDNVQDYRIQFDKAANDALERGDTVNSKALQLLSLVCSLMLDASNLKTSLIPMITFKDGRTSIKPKDFPEAQSSIFTEFAQDVEYPELAARLADLAWIVKRNITAAKAAISSYIQSSASLYCQRNWSARIKRLERALRLSFQINEKESVDAMCIRAELICALEPSHGLYSLIATKKICNLLLEFELFDPILLGEKILALIESQDVSDEFRYELLSLSAKAFLKGQNAVKAEQAKVGAAEALVKKAELNKQLGKMLIASHWLSQAIQAFQQCKGQQHRVAELQKEITLVNQECKKEMQRVSITTDITETVQKAMLAMQNTNRSETIIRFAYLSSPLPRKKLEEQTIEFAQNTIFQSTNEKRILNGDGRLVDIIPPLIGSEGDAYNQALKWGCYQLAAHHYSFMAQGVIIPARNELLKIHQVDEEMLTEMLQNCSFFPLGRASLWIKGFVYGFYNDFDAALSLLIPQFEHALRKTLESMGAVVLRVDSETKTHTEKSLKELLRLPEACEFLGDDLQFELQGLLTEREGFNFRNEFSHGLMSVAEFYSSGAVYLWWLFFHMAVRLSQPPDGS